MTVYVSHWQHVGSPGDFLPPVSSLYSFSTEVSPKQCPLLTCCRDVSDLHYLPCPPHKVLYVTTISAFPGCRSLSLLTPCRNHFSLTSWSFLNLVHPDISSVVSTNLLFLTQFCPKSISSFWHFYSSTAYRRKSRLLLAMNEVHSARSLASQFQFHSLPYLLHQIQV